MAGWWHKRWVQSGVALLTFALLGLIFMLVADRKDANYWSGYTDAQHWVDDGGYAAGEESITGYCSAQAAGRRSFERGCLDGAHNEMRPVR